MYCSGHFRVLLLTAALFSSGSPAGFSAFSQSKPDSLASRTEVNLRWAARPGVNRYRLQLAADSSFADILFDRVVNGSQYRIEDLEPGRYYWRIAPLNNRLGDFSSAGVIEVSKLAPRSSPTPVTRIPPGKDPKPRGTVIVRGGWRAAIGDIQHPVLAHLRSRTELEIVGINSEGVIFALDAASGVANWSTGRRAAKSKPDAPGPATVVLMRARSGLDNVVALTGVAVTAIDGATGRELWQSNLPAAAVNLTVAGDNRAQVIVLIDNSLQRMFVLDAVSGRLMSQIKLPHRVVGAPVALPGKVSGQLMFAYDSGQIEIRNLTGELVRSGDAGSPATTPPLFLRGRGGDFILVGTRSGLTALTANELNPLGMVAGKDDAPRGSLAAEDLDGDGSPEVIMLTSRGRLVAVSGADGSAIWEAMVGNDAQGVAFADLDADRVLDVVVTGGQSFAFAVSGKNGSVIWKDSEQPGTIANHSTTSGRRSILTMSFGTGALIIAGDALGNGLRAVEFPKGSAPAR